MGYEVDPEQMLAHSDDIARTGDELHMVAQQVERVAVAGTDFGGDRYQDYGAAYLAANQDLARLAGRLVDEVARISDLLRKTTGGYDESETTNEARINTAGAGRLGGA